MLLVPADQEKNINIVMEKSLKYKFCQLNRNKELPLVTLVFLGQLQLQQMFFLCDQVYLYKYYKSLKNKAKF